MPAQELTRLVNYFHNAFLNGVGPIGYVFTRMDSKCARPSCHQKHPVWPTFDLEQWDPAKTSGTATTCA